MQNDLSKDLEQMNIDYVDGGQLDMSEVESIGLASKDLSAANLASIVNLLEQYKKALDASGTAKWFAINTPFSISACPKHAAFFKAGATFKERFFIAGNRVGKSISGSYESALHATGKYPEWWEGKVFNRPTSGWAVGDTGQTVRDTLQKELLGPPGAFGTGMIPREDIVRVYAKPGIPNGVDSIEVKHVSGGVSHIGFKSYEQGIRSFYGTAKDWIHMDEEVPDTIYNECVIRTMTTDGLVYLTFTPLHGLTPLIINFSKTAKMLAGGKPILTFDNHNATEVSSEAFSRAMIQAGWDDAPWLDDSEKARLLETTPPHLREARSKGYPSIGSGNVYPIPLEDIQVRRFKIPHDWRRVYALDVGWNRTAVLFGAVHPSDDTIFIYDEIYLSKVEPEIVAGHIKSKGGETIPGVIDPASRGRSQVDGRKLITMYKQLGLRVREAINAVETGISDTWNRMSMDKLKVFDDLHNFAKEYLVYRRDLSGNIIKEHDHLMDCVRYITSNVDVALPPGRQFSTSMTQGRSSSHGTTGRKYDI